VVKIAFDQQVFLNQRFGGISRYIARLAENLDQHGETVKVFAPLHINHYLTALKPELVHGRQYQNKLWKPAFDNTSALLAKRAIAAWRPDVVHETYYQSTRSAPKNCTTILTLHDMIHEMFPAEFANVEAIMARKRAAIARADHIICISQSTRNDLLRFIDVNPDKVSVVHHGYDAILHSGVDLPEFGPHHKPFLLYVGQRGGYKNFARFVEAYANSSALRKQFSIVAFGGETPSTRDIDLLKRFDLSDTDVKFLAGDDEALGALYRNAAAFVYPSRYEGFGFPPLEAMANNCPVACSDASSMPEVVGDAAIYFDPTNTEDMAHAITTIVFDEAKKNTLIAAGQNRLKQFSWSKCAAETLSVYKI
jgi:glycosyltransferase involved in cell wall biosynthesis